jgi:hypothetical protein
MIKTRLVEISMDKDNALRYLKHLWIKKRLVDTPVDKDKACRYTCGYR